MKKRKERKIKCLVCGSIWTERKIRKYNKENGFILDYTPPCFNCGSNEFVIYEKENN